MSPLRWTAKSTRELAAELAAPGASGIGAIPSRSCCGSEGFSLQANAKTLEGPQHPDRDAQFRYISEQARDHQDTGDPVISVDTKKKELVGRVRQRRPRVPAQGQPGARAQRTTSMDKALGKAMPYGVYDVAADAGWVSRRHRP